MKTQTRLLRTYTLPFGPEPDEAWAQAGPDWTQHRVFDVFCINLYLASLSDIEPSTAVSLRLAFTRPVCSLGCCLWYG